ncbi:hypothetical protein [Streptomyces sp. NBC_00728]|uniref:NACHT N-terminal Helical domain 1-containing protein n=1 Tax=Streptomyces sp. NBC_00728 TaxID=2903676 RepID=UPI0038664684
MSDTTSLRRAGREVRLPSLAAAAVQDTFAAAGPIDAEPLCVADLAPGRLTDELPRPVADLAERAHGLYEELLRLYCAHPVEQLTAHPTFVARAAVAHAADRNATSGTARYGTFRGAAARPHRRTHSRPQVSSRRTRPDERNPLALVPVERSAHGP